LLRAWLNLRATNHAAVAAKDDIAMSGDTDWPEPDAGTADNGHDLPEYGSAHSASAKPSITEQIRSTVEDSKAWLESELDFQKVRFQDGGKRVKTISILMGAGAVLLLCSFITLLLGVFLTVAFYMGPITAMIAVPIIYALLGYMAFRIAIGKIGGLKTMIRNNGGITGLKTDENSKDAAVISESENESVAE
jgi:hypothetical protein